MAAKAESSDHVNLPPLHSHSSLNMGPIGAPQSGVDDPYADNPYVDFGGDGTVPSAVFDSGRMAQTMGAGAVSTQEAAESDKTSTV